MLRLATATAAAVVLLAMPSAAFAQDTDLFETARDGQADLELDRRIDDSNVGYGTQAGEELSCGGEEYGATAWYRFRAIQTGVHTVTTLGSDLDTVLSVYQAPTASVPNAVQRLGCNDEISDNESTSFVDVDAVAGRYYYVQVGGWTGLGFPPDEGDIVITVFQPPENNARAQAVRISSGAGVRGHNFNANEEAGEPLECGGIKYRATTWYKVTAPAIGDASVTVTSTEMDPVIAVYPAGSNRAIGCNDDAPGETRSASVSGRVTPGEYFIQVGSYLPPNDPYEEGEFEVRVAFVEDPDLDDDGSVRGQDCDDNNPNIRPGAPEAVNNEVDENCDGVLEYDRDGDGSRVPGSPGDCDDANPSRSPLKAEVPGNRLDENCDNVAAPFPVIASRLVSAWDLGKTTRMKEMILSNAIRGSKLAVRCRGNGCRFKKKTIRVRRNARQLKLHKKFTKRQRKFGKKARLIIRISGPNASPKETIYRMRPGKVPTRQDICITDRRRRC